MAAAKRFGKSFGSFKARRSLARTKDLYAFRFEIIGNTRDKRRLRPNHNKIDMVCLAKFRNRRMARCIEQGTAGNPPCPDCPALRRTF